MHSFLTVALPHCGTRIAQLAKKRVATPVLCGSSLSVAAPNIRAAMNFVAYL